MKNKTKHKIGFAAFSVLYVVLVIASMVHGETFLAALGLGLFKIAVFLSVTGFILLIGLAILFFGLYLYWLFVDKKAKTFGDFLTDL